MQKEGIETCTASHIIVLIQPCFPAAWLYTLNIWVVEQTRLSHQLIILVHECNG